MTSEDVVAIFPLPNLVFFPSTSLPLYIFEERYLQMVKDTIQNKQLIAIFLLKPGWEDDYYGNPPIYPIGTAGELAQVENLPDGKFNIVLKGLYRARAVEMVKENPYRTARVQVLDDLVSSGRKGLQDLTMGLWNDFMKLISTVEGASVESLRNADLAEFVNTLAMSLQIETEEKQALLEENDLVRRARSVQRIIQEQVRAIDWSRRYAHLKPIDPTVN